MSECARVYARRASVGIFARMLPCWVCVEVVLFDSEMRYGGRSKCEFMGFVTVCWASLGDRDDGVYEKRRDVEVRKR